MAYKTAFFDYVDANATRSAAVVVPMVRGLYPIASVADFGCGRGAWLAAWNAAGVTDVIGVDGDYVERDALLFDPRAFVAHDLTTPVDLGRRFDLVQSLEVAEHLPPHAADTFVDSLVRHGSIILFSAAVPGQGGQHHVNERPYGYWRDQFRRRGYALLDVVRPRLTGNAAVMACYRYNTFVYADRSRIELQLPALARYEIAEDAPIPDLAPAHFKLRRACLRPLPPAAITFFSRLYRTCVRAGWRVRGA